MTLETIEKANKIRKSIEARKKTVERANSREWKIVVGLQYERGRELNVNLTNVLKPSDLNLINAVIHRTINDRLRKAEAELEQL